MQSGAHTIVSDDLTQVFHVHGSGPICIVHPGGPGADWSYIRMPALEQHVTAVYVEPIGTGASARLADPGGYTLGRYARHLHKVIARLGVGPVHVLGHSHGGWVALTLAVDHPESVAGLILLNSAARAGDEWINEMTAGVGLFARRHADRPEIPDILAAFQEEETATTDEELTSLFRREFPIFFADYWSREEEFRPFRESAKRYAGPNVSFPDTVATYDVRAQLSAMEVPGLVMTARHDVFSSPRFSEELHQALPLSELVVLEDSGHFSPLEEPERIAAAAARFVAESRPIGA